MSNLILGEEATNRNRVDISRLQNLVRNVALVFIYAQTLIDLVSVRISFDRAATVVSQQGVWFFAEMPSVGTTFLGLLLASHAAYLGFKYAGSTTPSEATSR